SIFGPFLLAALGAWSTWGHVAAGAAWLGTTLTGVLKGKSAATGDPSLEGDAKPPGVMELVTQAAPYVFITCFLCTVAFLVHMLVSPAPVGPVPRAARESRAIEISTSAGPVKVSVPDSKTSLAAPNAFDRVSLWFERVKNEYWNSLRDAELDFDEDTPWYKTLTVIFLASALLTLLLSWRVDVDAVSLPH